MPYLVDTSVLARLANTADAQYAAALSAVVELHRRGEILHLTPQVLIEFRNVATRPQAQNGLGLSSEEAARIGALFEEAFPNLSESPAIYSTWKTIVERLGVIGKQVHDARLVAVCQSHNITHLITFNVGHFIRLTGQQSSVAVVDPAKVL